MLQLPKGTVISGPGLVANQFESNTEVSTKLSLLRSGGSEVVLGNLLTLPVGNGLLYIEPVYTQGKKEPKFPILNSVIVSFGSKIAYKPTLAQALDELFGEGTVRRLRAPSASPGTPTPAAPSTKALIAAAQKAFADGQEALKRGRLRCLRGGADAAQAAARPDRRSALEEVQDLLRRVVPRRPCRCGWRSGARSGWGRRSADRGCRLVTPGGRWLRGRRCRSAGGRARALRWSEGRRGSGGW